MKPLVVSAFTLLLCSAAQAAPAPASLKISENKRFLITGEGKPFFWLGDTAWELFHRLDRDETIRYLDTRARQGFTVIQAVALAELDGLNQPNALGHRPLIDNDPARPDVKDGPDNDYWDHVDFVIDAASQRGLVVGLLPTWGDKWNKKWGLGPEIFTPENAKVYGEWIGRRYKDKTVVWLLGGDRPVENDAHRAIITAMAEGVRHGDGGARLISFHPVGASSSADPFHAESWLDFNVRQNGHVIEHTRYTRTRADYDRQPVKPVLDGEPVYEAHPIDQKADAWGHTIAADVRRPLYWDLFSGAFGHTYGHHSVWQMASAKNPPVNNPLKSWSEALADPGASQMRHGRRLMESRPFLSRIPDDSIIVRSAVPTDIPGSGTRRFAATRDEAGTYAMIYFPVGKAATIRLDAIKHGPVAAWWFNPRDGSAAKIGEFPNTGTVPFTPPSLGEALDWVLVLDDASKNYPAPGQAALPQNTGP